MIPFLFLLSCAPPKQEADLIIHNAIIYTVDSAFSTQEAIAIKDGKITAVGSEKEILSDFTSVNVIDAQQKFIYPGFIDAHCHFYGFGKGLSELNLVGTRSFEEIIDKFVQYAKENPDLKWLIARGWDQNDWEQKEFPDKEKLDELFPNTPVLMKRVDGHAVLTNQCGLKLAGFNETTVIKGGELIKNKRGLTGVLIDNAADSLEKFIPKSDKKQIENALLRAQKECIAVGLTTADDAGLDKMIVEVIDELQKKEQLKLKIYAMLTPSNENTEYYLSHGIYKTDRLNVRSFKFYGDGALGSRGACLKKEYSDKKNWKGFLLNNIDHFKKYAALLARSGFQMNTHCIGDSAAKVILDIYKKYCDSDTDLRWRIEHAQVIDKTDFSLFNKNIIPSVQPTHATSDMYWAKERIGESRIHGAYAYNSLLTHSGIVALGTDFPVEDISPIKTFYAAVARKDASGFPENGFQKEEGLSRKHTLMGMTIWAAYSNFEEKEKGSIEKGKFADLVILDQDIMNCDEKKILQTKVLHTFINGEKVF